MALVEIVSHITPHYTDPKEALTFLETIESRVKGNSEAVSLAKVLQGNILLQRLNDLDATKV